MGVILNMRTTEKTEILPCLKFWLLHSIKCFIIPRSQIQSQVSEKVIQSDYGIIHRIFLERTREYLNILQTISQSAISKK